MDLYMPSTAAPTLEGTTGDLVSKSRAGLIRFDPTNDRIVSLHKDDGEVLYTAETNPEP
tara:strand:+ start:233 stop:409 length:177 start_codon:yes stop_codon:yes gene_type:complete